MSSSGSPPTRPATKARRRDDEVAGTTKQNALYKVIMTPVVLVSFLVSLAWVDFRYTLMRSHTHSDEDPRGMPRWLHHVLYRPQPYRYVLVKGEKEKVVRDADGNTFHYHSKQKKLLRMEAEDAFQVRWIVVAILGGIMASAAWGSWIVVSWGWQRWKQ